MRPRLTLRGLMMAVAEFAIAFSILRSLGTSIVGFALFEATFTLCGVWAARARGKRGVVGGALGGALGFIVLVVFEYVREVCFGPRVPVATSASEYPFALLLGVFFGAIYGVSVGLLVWSLEGAVGWLLLRRRIGREAGDGGKVR